MGNPLTDLPRSVTSCLLGTPPGLWGGEGLFGDWDWYMWLGRQKVSVLLHPSYTGVSWHTLEMIYVARRSANCGACIPELHVVFLSASPSCWVPVEAVESPVQGEFEPALRGQPQQDGHI